jgi:hypothetical protein
MPVDDQGRLISAGDSLYFVKHGGPVPLCWWSCEVVRLTRKGGAVVAIDGYSGYERYLSSKSMSYFCRLKT